MHEMQVTAHDCGIRMFYTDTDSRHIEAAPNNSLVELLGKKFQEKYGRELIGSKLGQFHCDFSFNSKDFLPRAVESYILAKKVYVHKIECGNDGKLSYDHHVRMNGVTNTCIGNDPMSVYQRLSNGEKITFRTNEVYKEL